MISYRTYCLLSIFFFFLMIRPPPNSTLFPYPTLFRFNLWCLRHLSTEPLNLAFRKESTVDGSVKARLHASLCCVWLARYDDSSFAASLLVARRSEEHTSELQSQSNLVCRLLLEKKTLI